MTIALIQPSQHNRPYKNPFRLQALETVLRKRFPGCEIMLFDADVSGELPSISAEFAVIDTTESSVPDAAAKLRTSGIRHMLLFGDVVDYGEGDRAKAFLERHCAPARVWLSTEADIPELLETLGLRGSLPALPFAGSAQAIHAYAAEKSLQYMAKGVSDGCEMRCAFCRHSCGDRPVRCFPCPSLPDIRSYYSVCRAPVFIQFSDENFFGASEQRLIRVLELSQALREPEACFRFGVDTRIDAIFPPAQLSSELLALHEACWREMLGAGLRYCFLGVESFSPAQLQRYNKNNDLSRIPDCIRFFEQHGLEFTCGLILWDPLMSREDLRVNLRSIQSLQLLGHTASLWKPLRIPMKSLYRKRFFSDADCGSNDDFFLLRENVNLYRDASVQIMARYVFPLYHLFDDCGYRHSDASSFAVLLENTDPVFLRHIPHQMAELEMTVLSDLLDHAEPGFSPSRETAYERLCTQTCQDIITGLENECADCSANAGKVKRYYHETFSRVLRAINRKTDGAG